MHLDEEEEVSSKADLYTTINHKLEPKHIYHDAYSKNTILLSCEGVELRVLWKGERAGSAACLEVKRRWSIRRDRECSLR